MMRWHCLGKWVTPLASILFFFIQTRTAVCGDLIASSEFRVNTYTYTNQWYPYVAMDADGDFAVAWSSEGQDGSGSGIYAQRYNVAGVPQGSEFRVNTYTNDYQWCSPIAIDADGDFVIAWESWYGQDGSGSGIYAQRYDAAGVPQGSEFRVNTYTNDDQFYPSVAMHADGDFVIAWASEGQDGSCNGIYAQRYNAAGVPQGSEFRVNTYTNDDQYYTSVAMDTGGNFVVTWTSYGQDGSGDGNYAQRYDAAGIPQGSEFRVNTYTDDNQQYPIVAMDADGDFVIAWESYGQDGSKWGVYGQRYNAAGVPQGSEFQVNSYNLNNQWLAGAAMDADGDFAVAWSSEGQDGSYYGVYAQRYNVAGVPEGGEFRVNIRTNDNEVAQWVAMDADGDFVVTWGSRFQDGSGYGVYARRYSKDSDTDGLPDWWEKQYFGGTTNAVADVDNDNDSHNNLNEYLAGTDPTNQSSVFAITEITGASSSDFLIKWNSVMGKYYALKECSNLVTGSWDVVTNNIPDTEPVNTVTVKVSGADALFYRVEVEQ